ncbi:DNA polymerase III PolC-type [Symmachiella dynata]|uniref:DNA polymerase III PolC-type n=1 Tax=Symmachiella dynata TaxID=2527995 RepID=A0A517ZKC6_9PLAN|nr:3'-5' exonuclease [Symmachiella dynata]QDU42863.1 DNA polymerase III PolC-type [Symmachiella dynata]
MPFPLYETKLAELEVAVFDLETSGLMPSKHRIIQIAVVLFDQGQPTNNANNDWVQLVFPGEEHLPLEDVIVELTGIDTESLRGQPTIDTVLTEFDQLVNERVVSGHNVKRFDLPFIRRAESHTRIDVQSDFYIDTLLLAQKLHPGRPHKLADEGRHYGIDFDEEELHDALADTRLCAQVLAEQIKELADHNVQTFGDMIDWL